ncbi:hypothetical protein HY227_00600 [Candidatus Wolfebacteria bacterium]|nr:hypothetical protein [Candidatus Wolfebacteria bacterium]
MEKEEEQQKNKGVLLFLREAEKELRSIAFHSLIALASRQIVTFAPYELEEATAYIIHAQKFGIKVVVTDDPLTAKRARAVSPSIFVISLSDTHTEWADTSITWSRIDDFTEIVINFLNQLKGDK